MKFHSPAKLNLFFRVLKKRDDGFHKIASLVQTISFCDTIYVKQAEKDCLTCTDPSIPIDQRNLIHKARELFRKKTNFLTPLTIHIDKNIPVKGGFGGGSSNVATILYAMNLLSKEKIDLSTLARWAGQISSDAPFFFQRGRRICVEKGKLLKRLRLSLQPNFLLQSPMEKVLPHPLFIVDVFQMFILFLLIRWSIENIGVLMI